MKKRIALPIVLGMLLIMLALPTVLAASEINKKDVLSINSTTSEYGMITIKDKTTDTLKADVELLYNSDFCFVNCAAEGTIKTYEQGKLFDSVRFKKLKKDQTWDYEPINEYTIYIQTGIVETTVPKYKEECINTNGTEHCYNVLDGTKKGPDEIVWEEYDGSLLEPGKYRWKLEGQKDRYETVDWLGTFFDVELDEWALWGEDNGLISYYPFDDASGTTAVDFQGSADLTVDDSWNATGILQGAKNLNGVASDYGSTLETLHGADEAMTFNFWVNKSGLNWTGEEAFVSTRGAGGGSEAGLIEIYGTNPGGAGEIVFKAYYDDGVLKADRAAWMQPDNGEWTMVTGTINSTSIYMYIDGSYVNHTAPMGGFFAYSAENLFIMGSDGADPDVDNGIIDEFGMWNRTLSDTEISDLYNGGSPPSHPDAGPGPIVDLWGPDSDIILYYSLNETSYDTDLARDWAGGTINGTAMNISFAHWDSDGLLAGGLQMGGNDRWLNVSEELNLANENTFTLQFWSKVNVDSQDGWYFTESNWNATTPYWGLKSDGGNLTYESRNDASATKVFNVNVTINDGSWHHIILTRSTDDYKIYIDGVLSLDDTYTIGAIDVNNTIFSGWKRETSSEPGVSNVTYDEIGIWNRTLNSSDVTELYNSGIGLPFGENFSVQPVIELIYPTAISYIVDITDLNYQINSPGSGTDDCWYSLDEGVTNSSVQACGTNWTGLSSGEGTSTWTVYVNDTSSNEHSDAVTFSVDTIDPVPNIVYPVAGTFYNAPVVELNYTATDTNLDICFFSKDDGASNSSTQACATLTNWTGMTDIEGSNTWILFATDTFGRLGTDSVTFTRDTILPDPLNITYPMNISYAGSVDDLQYTANDTNLFNCWYSLDGGANSSPQTCGTNWSGLDPADGPHTWTIYANDSAGNINTTSVTFLKDTVIPTDMNITLPLNISYAVDVTTLNYEVTDDNLDVCWYTLDLGATNSSPQTCGTNWSGLSSSEGSNTWSVWANDSADNRNFTSVTFFKDTLPPTINLTGPLNETMTSTTIDLNYTYSEANPDVCWYSLDGGTTNSTTVSCGTNWTGLTASDGSNTWTVYINESSSGIYNESSVTFSVDSIVPQPIIVGPTNTTYNSNVSSLNYTATDTNLDSCWFSPNDGVYNTTPQVCGTNFTNLNSTASNAWTIYANDTAGNLNSTTVNWAYEMFYNSHDANLTAYETDIEGFILNFTSTGDAELSANLIYNGTEYTAVKEGDDTDAIFAYNLSIPAGATGNISYLWNVSYGGSYSATNTYYQNVSEIYFSICDENNATINTTYLNISYEDEVTGNPVTDVTVTESTWKYWLGDPDNSKTYTYANLSEVNSHMFCFSPTDKELFINMTYKYTPSGISTPRTYTNSSISLSNTTTNLTLLTLTSGDLKTIQVIDTASSAIVGATIDVSRDVSGVTTAIDTGVTDSAGRSTFYLYPLYTYTFETSAPSCSNSTVVITPTDSAYTITLSCEGAYPTQVSGSGDIDGIRYTRGPSPGVIYGTGVYNFTYRVRALKENLDGIRMELWHSNGTYIGYNESRVGVANETLCDEEGCLITYQYSVSVGDNIKGKYFVDVGNGYVLLEGDARWYQISSNVSDTGTIKKFASNLKDLFDNWHSEDLTDADMTNRAEYSRFVFIFLALAIILALVSRITGYDARNPGSFLIVLWIVVLIGSFANGFGGEGYFYFDNLTAFTFLNNYILLFVLTMVGSGHYISTMRRQT